MNNRTRRIGFLSSLCLTAFALVGCRSVPVTGRTQLMLSGSSYENRLGAEAYVEYQKKYPRSGNERYVAMVSRIGNAIKQQSGRNDFSWEFVVLETPVQNAFCLPGGKVAVFSGIIDVCNNEAELATIIAHEIGHAIARHGGERMSWANLRTLGALGLNSAMHSETANEVYGTGTQLGVMLPFSRKHEHEADLIGLVLMAKAGYNPKAAVQFWTRMSKGKPSKLLDNLKSTHPCDADRVAHLTNNMFMAEQEYKKCRHKRGFGEFLRQ